MPIRASPSPTLVQASPFSRLLDRFEESEARKKAETTISLFDTKDEFSSFHENSQYPQILEGRDLGALEHLFTLGLENPRTPNHEIREFLGLSLEFLLRKGQALIHQETRVTRQILNSFSHDHQNIRPIKPLQEAATLARYSRVFRAFVVFSLSSSIYQEGEGPRDYTSLYRPIPSYIEPLRHLRQFLLSLTSEGVEPRSSDPDRPDWDDGLTADEDDEILMHEEVPSEDEEAYEAEIFENFISTKKFSIRLIREGADLLQAFLMSSAMLRSTADRKNILYSFLACYCVDYKAKAFKSINIIGQCYSAIIKGVSSIHFPLGLGWAWAFAIHSLRHLPVRVPLGLGIGLGRSWLLTAPQLIPLF
jgi:hypothetical protein